MRTIACAERVERRRMEDPREEIAIEPCVVGKIAEPDDMG